MKPDLVKVAKQYIKAGFYVIPVSYTKEPSITSWREFQKRQMSLEEADRYFKDATHIAVLCGGQSRVVCLDADMKYDLSGDLWERFKAEVPKKILKKLMCQETQNKGYHLAFKAPASRLFGNQKFASRYTTCYEKHQTYMDAFNHPKTRDKALKIADQDKSRILFESRSGTPDACGGYFLISPSPGYKLVYGKIQELSEEEYDILVETARSFNELADEDKSIIKGDFQGRWEKTPFDHYDEEGDVLQLLFDYGWMNVSNYYGRRSIDLKRPGQTHARKSAMFDTETRVFNVFSTSTCFDVGRGYKPSSVLIQLAHDGDSQAAYKYLMEKGYGVKEGK